MCTSKFLLQRSGFHVHLLKREYRRTTSRCHTYTENNFILIKHYVHYETFDSCDSGVGITACIFTDPICSFLFMSFSLLNSSLKSNLSKTYGHLMRWGLPGKIVQKSSTSYVSSIHQISIIRSNEEIWDVARDAFIRVCVDGCEQEIGKDTFIISKPPFPSYLFSAFFILQNDRKRPNKGCFHIK